MTGNDVMGTGSHVIWSGKPLTSGKKGWRAQGTGSRVIWDGKPLTSREKGSRAQGSRDLGWETADQLFKRDRRLRAGKTADPS